MTGPPVSAAFKADGEPTPAAIGFARKHGVEVVGARARSRRRRAPTSPTASTSEARRRSTCCRMCSPASCATWLSRSRCTGTRGSMTAAANCCSAVPSGGSSSSTAAGSCRSRSAAPRPRSAASSRKSVRPRSPTGTGSSRPAAAPAARSRSARSTSTARSSWRTSSLLERGERHDKIARELDANAQRLGGRVGGAASQSGLLQEVPDLVEYPVGGRRAPSPPSSSTLPGGGADDDA